jgi:hypothetical protein
MVKYEKHVFGVMQTGVQIHLLLDLMASVPSSEIVSNLR